MEFRLLGPLEVVDGGPVPLGGPRQRTVLAHLLLHADRVITAERLIDEVWGEEPPETARSTLATYASHLRKALGTDRLEGSTSGYRLRVRPHEVDAFRFQSLVERARELAGADPAAAARTYAEALALWRGGALEDLADQPTLVPEITRLEELRLAATEERIAAELDLGRDAELVPDLEGLTAHHPLRERLWGQLMLALYRSGRQGEALDAYRSAREILAEELGIDPSPELQRLHEQVLRQDPALEVAGEPLRGYRLLERVGAGAFGEVHRAFQPQVGREVAVKAIHPHLANDPEFIRRFEAEAQLVARLEHPHIVPLYDFWREPDGAYLVMRYLRGGSLRERLAESPLPPEETSRALDQVARALEVAHRHGVIHRDVKPANVLFDEERNAYLTDFGIAKDLAAGDPAAPGRTSRPLAFYLTPEEIRGDPPTPATDVYGLGVLLHEALAGRHPFADTPPEEVIHKHLHEPLPPIGAVRPDLPAAVVGVISRATAKDPTARYPGAAELAAAFREALAPSAAEPVLRGPVEARNPYKGLRPFDEADAPDFFGREALVRELLSRLADPGARFLAVVGASGSGKSSVVQAGLVPAVRGGALTSSERWFVVDMHPGTHPFEELEAALTRVATDHLGTLERDAGGLVQAAEEFMPPGTELLLVVDQFEELFTLVEDEDTRAGFVATLHASATAPGSRLRVVVTLRADFLDRPLSYPGLAELMKAHTVMVTPLAPEELERAVSGPAERSGVNVAPGLVADVVADVADQPGALPLLQYALTELFDHRDGSTLTVEAYREVGGVAGALARRAEDLYSSLTEAGRGTVRQLFLRLITLGEEGSEDTRRRVLRAELTSLDVDREAMETAIDAFGARRLLSFDRDPVTRSPTVEVAHEALLREWARLRGWLETARDDVRLQRRLAAAAREWTEAGYDPSLLLRGAHLARVGNWRATSGLAVTAEERHYLEASLAQREADRADERARQAREAALERRSRSRLRALVAVFAAAAVIAGALTVVAFAQRGRAEREARFTTARELAAGAVANLDVDPERSILLALEAAEATWESDGLIVREAEEALRRGLRSSRIVRTVPQGGWGLAITSDGTRFATGGSDPTDNTATVWDTETGEELLTLTGPDGGRLTVAYSPDDRLIAAAHSGGTVWLRDADSGEERGVLHGSEGLVRHPAFSPDGRLVAAGDADATVRIWDVSTGADVMTLTGHDDEVYSVAFSPDGSRLASASEDTTVRIWDVSTGETIVTLSDHDWPVVGIAFSPDGSRIASASLDTTARIWDSESGANLMTVFGRGGLFGVDFSPDGTRIATGGSDGAARVWDAATGQEVLFLAGHTGDVGNVAFTPDGDRLVTSAFDGTTRIWDVSVGGGREWLTVPGAKDMIVRVAFSPDGTRFAAPAEPSGVTIWDTQTGEKVITLTGYEPKLTTVAFSPDGRRIAAGSDLALTPPVWDVESGELLFTLTGHDGDVGGVAFSPDGSRLVTGGYDGTARVWDAATGEEQGILRSGDPVHAVAFSPDGRLIVAVGWDRTVMVWDATTLKRVATLTGHRDPIEHLAFDREGLLLTASGDRTARIWDLGSGEELMTLRGHRGVVSGVAVSPDGSRVATASHDATVKLWDPGTGRELLTLSSAAPVFGVDFSPDGRLLATGSLDGVVALHLISVEEVVELARERVTRTLTDEECRQYLRLQTCPRR